MVANRMISFRQQGAALVMSIFILFILSLLAISSLQSGIFQERMVSASRDSRAALEGAEAALMAAENYLYSINAPSDFDGNSSGLYPNSDDAMPARSELLSETTWAANSNSTIAVDYDGLPEQIKQQYENSLARPPRYFIEQIGDVAVESGEETQDLNSGNASYSPGNTGGTTMQAFRVVAWSGGSSGHTPRVVEAYFFREF